MHPLDVEWTPKNLKAMSLNTLARLYHDAFGSTWAHLRAQGKARLIEMILEKVSQGQEAQDDNDMAEAYKDQVRKGERND